MTNIVWFRQDLRINDNPALAHAARRGVVTPVYILDDTPRPAGRPMGGASRWWLHHSLTALAKSLGALVLLRGEAASVLPDFARKVGATGVFWNRCYEPHAISRDAGLKSALRAGGVEVESFNGALLHEPWEIKTGGGGPYKVFTPFWRACLGLPAREPEATGKISLSIPPGIGESLSDWRLPPEKPDWARSFAPLSRPGEAGARERLAQFLDNDLEGYAQLRDRPDLPNVSRLSPHLHFGEISPRHVRAAVALKSDAEPRVRADATKFLAELGWREFAHHLLFHFPTLAETNWKPAFDAYPWADDSKGLAAWRKGRTGYPFVDAGMRELWATGYMHNRVRMVAASFLVKHLRIDWRRGEDWFWDTLVDADMANNAASWQWVAGSGADAAPYFRIFNPLEQGRRFDPDGAYVRRWCPELTALPTRFIHAPFEASEQELRAAGVVLGETYPRPIVDHAKARVAALAGYEAVKGQG